MKHKQGTYYTMISVTLTFQALIHLLFLYQFNFILFLNFTYYSLFYKKRESILDLKPREFNLGNWLQM